MVMMTSLEEERKIESTRSTKTIDYAAEKDRDSDGLTATSSLEIEKKSECQLGKDRKNARSERED